MKQHYPLDPVTGIENPALAWANGNPATGANGSYPPFGLFLDPQKEILAAQRASGLTDSADGSDAAQLSQAISRGTWLGTLAQPATANDLTAALPGSVLWPVLMIGMEFSGVIGAANTGPMTVTLAGFATLPGKLNLVRKDGQPLGANDIPASVPFRFRFDGAQFRMSGPVGSELRLTIFNALQAALVPVPFALTTSGIWTKPPGLVFADIRAVGSGAGAALGYNNAGTALIFGGGGGNGGFARRTMAASALPATVAFTLGAPGQGYKIATAGFGPGTDGGDAVFGAFLTARGGKGAPQPTVNLPGAGGLGGGFVATDEVYGGAAGYGGERGGITAPTPFGSNGQGGFGGARTTGGPAYDGQDGQPGGLFILQYILVV